MWRVINIHHVSPTDSVETEAEGGQASEKRWHGYMHLGRDAQAALAINNRLKKQRVREKLVREQRGMKKEEEEKEEEEEEERATI